MIYTPTKIFHDNEKRITPYPSRRQNTRGKIEKEREEKMLEGKIECVPWDPPSHQWCAASLAQRCFPAPLASPWQGAAHRIGQELSPETTHHRIPQRKILCTVCTDVKPSRSLCQRQMNFFLPKSYITSISVRKIIDIFRAWFFFVFFFWGGASVSLHQRWRKIFLLQFMINPFCTQQHSGISLHCPCSLS